MGGADTRSISLQQALTGALTSNPDLVALRLGNPSAASAEAVEVARRFPTTLNPTVFIDYRPVTLIPNGTFGNNGTSGSGNGTGAGTGTGSHGFYHNGQGYLLVAVRQPVEFGHQTTHRHGIAKAAYGQLQWQIVQAELNALVQTYRLFQTAAYRRERLGVAERLADFNDELFKTLERRSQGSEVQTQPADVSLQKVESRAHPPGRPGPPGRTTFRPWRISATRSARPPTWPPRSSLWVSSPCRRTSRRSTSKR